MIGQLNGVAKLQISGETCIGPGFTYWRYLRECDRGTLRYNIRAGAVMAFIKARLSDPSDLSARHNLCPLFRFRCLLQL
jgi:hypothetical protein